MGRGPGKIEQAIARIAADRGQRRRLPIMITAEDVAREAYGVVFPPGDGEGRPAMRTHYVAAIRAMHSFVRKHRIYRLAGGQGRTRLVIVRADEIENIDKLVKQGILPPGLKKLRRE